MTQVQSRQDFNRVEVGEDLIVHANGLVVVLNECSPSIGFFCATIFAQEFVTEPFQEIQCEANSAGSLQPTEVVERIGRTSRQQQLFHEIASDRRLLRMVPKYVLAECKRTVKPLRLFGIVPRQRVACSHWSLSSCSVASRSPGFNARYCVNKRLAEACLSEANCISARRSSSACSREACD